MGIVHHDLCRLVVTRCPTNLDLQPGYLLSPRHHYEETTAELYMGKSLSNAPVGQRNLFLGFCGSFQAFFRSGDP
jgi:hypothetical protein